MLAKKAKGPAEKKVYSEIIDMSIPKGLEGNPLWLDYVRCGWKCSICQTQTSWNLWVCASCGATRPAGYKKPEFLDKKPEETEKKDAASSESADKMDDDDDDNFDPDADNMEDDEIEKYMIDHKFDDAIFAKEIDEHKMKVGDTRLLGAGNGTGPCGMGDDEPQHVLPTVMEHTRNKANKTFVRVFSANCISAAIDEDGQLWTWGESERGALGRPVPKESGAELHPAVVAFPEPDTGCRVVDVSIGATHMGAVLENGNFYTWGSFMIRGEWKGHHVERQRRPPPHRGETLTMVKQVESPYLMNNTMNNVKVQAVASGSNHCVALDTTGHVWIIGLSRFLENDHGRPFREAFQWKQLAPHRLFAAKKKNIRFSMIASGKETVWAVDKSRTRIFGHGNSTYAQCGPEGGEPLAQRALVEIPFVDEAGVANTKKIARLVGQNHVWAVLETGEAVSWGRNADMTLGYPTAVAVGSDGQGNTFKKEAAHVSAPRVVPLTQKALDVRCGDDHTLVLLSDGSTIGFGNTLEYRVGDGSCDQADSADVPVTVFTSQNLGKHDLVVKDFAAGSSHSMFLLERVKKSTESLSNYVRPTPGKVDPSLASKRAKQAKKAVAQEVRVEGKKKVVGKRVRRDAQGNFIGQGSGRPPAKKKPAKKSAKAAPRKATKKKAAKKKNRSVRSRK